MIVSSRRAASRATISPADLNRATVELGPGRGPDPLSVAARLVELGYSREPLVEEPGQFSLRGGIRVGLIVADQNDAEPGGSPGPCCKRFDQGPQLASNLARHRGTVEHSRGHYPASVSSSLSDAGGPSTTSSSPRLITASGDGSNSIRLSCRWMPTTITPNRCRRVADVSV